jgi:hypothetical protein
MDKRKKMFAWTRKNDDGERRIIAWIKFKGER